MFLLKNNDKKEYKIDKSLFKDLFPLGIGDWGLGIGDWGLGPIPIKQRFINFVFFFIIIF